MDIIFHCIFLEESWAIQWKITAICQRALQLARKINITWAAFICDNSFRPGSIQRHFTMSYDIDVFHNFLPNHIFLYNSLIVKLWRVTYVLN